MLPSERPVILLGHGVRAAGAADLAPQLLALGVPVLTSWQAKDLVDNTHPMYFGCPGIYGNRAANKILHGADFILAIGNRMAIWNVGYEGPRPDQRVTMLDIDEAEAHKFANVEYIIRTDVSKFIENFDPRGEVPDWLAQCTRWREQYPRIESPAHDDAEGYINSYRFIDALNRHLRADEIIAIDCGSACASAFQGLVVKPPQRILSSGGLGEMGCALPAAIGASFARNKAEVLCLVGDGALMLNLQELQTIVHHWLPIKIIVFRNDGYLMIRHTQSAAGMAHSGVNNASGVSCPRFQQIAFAFGIHAAAVRTWEDFAAAVPALLAHDGPALIEYHMHPQQKIVPKLDPVYVNGKATSPPFDQMSPVLA